MSTTSTQHLQRWQQQHTMGRKVSTYYRRKKIWTRLRGSQGWHAGTVISPSVNCSGCIHPARIFKQEIVTRKVHATDTCFLQHIEELEIKSYTPSPVTDKAMFCWFCQPPSARVLVCFQTSTNMTAQLSPWRAGSLWGLCGPLLSCSYYY